MDWKNKFPQEHRYFETDNGILYCGDCLDTIKNFPDECIDLVITSPPYDTLRFYHMNNEKELKTFWNFDKFIQIAKELSRILCKGGVIVWVVNDETINGSETGTSFKQALYFKEQCGLCLYDTMIYAKYSPTFPSKNRYNQIFEYMFVFSKGKVKTFNPLIDQPNKSYNKTSWGLSSYRDKNGILQKKEKINVKSPYRLRNNIWYYGNGYNVSTQDEIAYKHPAIFPDKLAYDHIYTWSNENDIVLDPFMGSGTVAKQCQILNRKWIGIEINSDYCEIIKKRLLYNNEVIHYIETGKLKLDNILF